MLHVRLTEQAGTKAPCDFRSSPIPDELLGIIKAALSFAMAGDNILYRARLPACHRFAHLAGEQIRRPHPIRLKSDDVRNGRRLQLRSGENREVAMRQ
jgi:hypothetical protein